MIASIDLSGNCELATDLNDLRQVVPKQVFTRLLPFEPLCEKIINLGSDTNWAVQSQKMVRGWKFWI